MGPDTQDHGTVAAARDWGAYWRGRTGGPGDALAGVERAPELDAFWATVFSGLPKTTRVLDLACGAGTVLRAARAAGLGELTGLDVSAEALAALRARLPGVATVAASADAPPFASGSFDRVSSQFGVEYADLARAAPTAAALLASNGRLVWLCHHAEGAIAAEVRGRRAEAEAIRESGFVERAKAVFRADAGEAAAFGRAAARFGAAQDAVMALARDGSGLAAHLYGGTQRLWERRASYALEDVTGWLDGMAGEIAAFEGRMGGMLAAALSDADVAELRARLEAAGLVVETGAVELGGRVAAWRVEAGRVEAGRGESRRGVRV